MYRRSTAVFGLAVLLVLAANAVRAEEKNLALDLGGGAKLEMVLIQPGTFTMGDEAGREDEKPAHRVQITKPFYLGKYEVTQRQWELLMGENPSDFRGPDNPVNSVSWEDCQAFVKKLNEKFAGEGLRFALPNEAQWEYACRAGGTGKFCFGDNEAELGDYAWFAGNSGQTAHPVGQKKPNAWGLYDMHGNVWEWCADRYAADYYKNSPQADPTGPDAGKQHPSRGGALVADPVACRSAARLPLDPPFRYHYFGVRVMCEKIPAKN